MKQLILFSHRVKGHPLFRYGVVGLTTNALGYALYALVTWAGLPPKIAMTLLYLFGATLGFIGNRRWTFSYEGKLTTNALRYGFAHSLGYGLNLLLLTVFVDHFHFSHLLVQAVAIFIVAGFLFLLFTFFVFPQSKPEQVA